MSYSQLKSELNEKNSTINNMKLHNLNIERNYISLSNSRTDYQRLVNLIRLNQIPRIQQIIKSCLNSNYGVNGIIEKLHSAIKGNSTR